MDKHKLNLNTTVHIFNVWFDEWRIVKRTECPGTVNWEMKYQNFQCFFPITGYRLTHVKHLYELHKTK